MLLLVQVSGGGAGSAAARRAGPGRRVSRALDGRGPRQAGDDPEKTGKGGTSGHRRAKVARQGTRLRAPGAARRGPGRLTVTYGHLVAPAIALAGTTAGQPSQGHARTATLPSTWLASTFRAASARPVTSAPRSMLDTSDSEPCHLAKGEVQAIPAGIATLLKRITMSFLRR